MNWETILTSIFSSACVVGVIEFVFKQHYIKHLEKDMEIFKDEIRKKDKIFDSQSNVYKLLVSLTYKSRNCIRDINILINKKEQLNSHDMHELEQLVYKLKTYSETFSELLFEEKAILDKKIFKYAHDLKHLIMDLYSLIRYCDRHKEKIEIVGREYNDRFERIDYLYNKIDELVHQKLYIE